MLKTTVLPRVVISSDEVMHQRTDITLMSYDKNVHQIKIPTDLTEGEINRVLVIFTFPFDESVIQSNGSWVDGHIQFTLPEILRTQRGDFYIEVNIDLIDSQITFARYRAKVVKSDIDTNTNHVASVYFELFEDFVNEVADTKDAIDAQVIQAQDSLQEVSDTLTAVNGKVATVNDTADNFTADVADKSQLVDDKYNAFDTDITEANQTIDDILALQPQFQAVLDETTGKDVISAPEIILARNGEADLKTRLDKEHQQVTAQLAQTATKQNLAGLNNFFDNYYTVNDIDRKVNTVYSKLTTDGDFVISQYMTPVIIPFTTLVEGSADLQEPNGFKVKTAGIYHVSLNIAFTPTTESTRRNIYIAKNATVVADVQTNSSLGTWETMQTSTIVKLEENDVIRASVLIGGNEPVTLPKRDFAPTLSIVRLGEIPTDDKRKGIISHIIGTGQSLAVGAEGTPPLTTQIPFHLKGKALKFNGGIRPQDTISPIEDEWGKVLNESVLSYFEDATETLNDFNGTKGAQGETISSAMVYTANSGNDKLLISQHGWGGKGYDGLKKGTIPYNNSLLAVQKAKEIANNLGYDYEVTALTVVHGEFDQQANTGFATYKQYLKDWIRDYNIDVKNITGQSKDVKMFVCQTASASYFGAHSTIADAQYQASKEDANIICIGPKYHLPYVSLHMPNIGYRALGEYYGKAYRFEKNEFTPSWKPLSPESWSITGNVITINFHVPKPPLVIDTDLVPATENYGFSLIGDTNNVSMTNIEVVDGNKIRITLSGPPNIGVALNYAFDVNASHTGKIGKNGVRGNLRDSDTTPSIFTGEPLYNWCVHFNGPL